MDMEPPKDSRWLHNYNKPSRKSRQKPARVYVAGGVNKDLLARMPATLTDIGRAAYLSAARAPWIEAIHAPLLACWAEAHDRLSVVTQELDRCMRDPTFATPGSEAHQTGKLYLRMTTRLERQLLDMAKALHLTPLSRAKAGIVLID